MVSEKSLANLRPLQKGCISPRQGTRSSIQSISDKLRIDVLKAFQDGKGVERLLKLTQSSTDQDFIQVCKVITGFMSKQINIDRTNTDNRLTITANVSQPSITPLQPATTILTTSQDVTP